MGMWSAYHSCISLKSLILREGEELCTSSSSLGGSSSQEGKGEDLSRFVRSAKLSQAMWGWTAASSANLQIPSWYIQLLTALKR